MEILLYNSEQYESIILHDQIPKIKNQDKNDCQQGKNISPCRKTGE
ncbi:hypothetical protein LEP1GSC132_3479 [Leptospira kirschneri str. 200803703]|nr:hypothetical protein LEP1GSC176_3608 [Leptospira kirschneri str. MMD1493]EMO66817.1 hypothetical protein LEP1GSC132_3479 [Leptospira kirschneri str. 200803703]